MTAKLLLQQVLIGGSVLVATSVCAADSSATSAALRSASWQGAVQYITQRFPACKEYPQSTAVASFRGDRIYLHYADLDYGTTTSFPLRSPFTAEAHSSSGSWRLFVRFRKDVVTTDVPSWNGHGRTSVFFCDGDRDTTEGLGIALTRLRELLVGGLGVVQMDSLLPEIIVQYPRETDGLADGKRATLTARVDAADLNLSTPAGAAELRARINDIAHNLCRQLQVQDPYAALPGQAYATQTCVQDAVAAAKKRVDELIAAAQKRTS